MGKPPDRTAAGPSPPPAGGLLIVVCFNPFYAVTLSIGFSLLPKIRLRKVTAA